jgi:hypothetical protein
MSKSSGIPLTRTNTYTETNDCPNKKPPTETPASHHDKDEAAMEMADDTNNDLAWDDDNFEPGGLTIRLPDFTKETHVATTKTEPEDPQQDDDDWLTPLDSLSTSNETPAAAPESYLTEQFQRIHTPVSQKKKRCSHCTRPVPGIPEDGSPLLCSRCTSSR